MWGLSIMNVQRSNNSVRLLLAAIIIILGAYWAGARYGQHEPTGVAAVQRATAKDVSAATVAARDASLT